MRPIFFDFPTDPHVTMGEDQFMLGPDLLVAPILYEGALVRNVYLPTGADWVDAWTGAEFRGGQTISAAAPIEKVPVYWRKGSPYFFQF